MSARGSSNHHVPVVVGLVVFMVVGAVQRHRAPAVVRAAPGDVGQAGPSFAGSGADPTGTKPESKVWFNDGFWWASMYNARASAYTIHRLSGTTWTNTGAVIDARENTHSDALWDQAAASCTSRPTSTRRARPTGTTRSCTATATTRAPTPTRSTADSRRPSTPGARRRSSSTRTPRASCGRPGPVAARSGSTGRRAATRPGARSSSPRSAATRAIGSDDISTLVAFGGNKIGLLWSKPERQPRCVPLLDP